MKDEDKPIEINRQQQLFEFNLLEVNRIFNLAGKLKEGENVVAFHARDNILFVATIKS
jgi:hypothetical protein